MNIKGFRRMLFGEDAGQKRPEIQGALRTRRGCRATLRQSDTYRQGSGQSTGFRQRPPDAVSRHRIRLRHLRADMEYLPPDGGVLPSSSPPNGHGNAGFRAPGTA